MGYDEERAVRELAEGIVAGDELTSDRFRYDAAAVADVVRIVRAVGRAGGRQRFELGHYVAPPPAVGSDR